MCIDTSTASTLHPCFAAGGHAHILKESTALFASTPRCGHVRDSAHLDAFRPAAPAPYTRHPSMARISARVRVRCALGLAAVAAVSAAAGVPHAKPVHRILSTASRVTSPAPGEVAYHSEVRNALGSVRHFSYAGKYASHVVSLDTLPQVTAVACDDTAHMVLTLTDARVLEAWQSDLVLVGMAEAWQCKDKRGNVAPFARELLGFRDIVLTARDGRVTHVDHPKHIDFARVGEHTTASVSLHTELAPPQACFEKLHLKYFTRPAPDAAAVAKQMKQASNAPREHRQLCGWFDIACDISNAASAIANAASTVVNTVTNAAESAWDAISSVRAVLTR
ncbi:hypothetical protein EON62_00470 [archaeon]|nr:MAG: hypothetical protein EON62_00470 [archaeon]